MCIILTPDNDSCDDDVFQHTALKLTMLVLWGRALSIKEIWHGNFIVPEVRLLSFSSRMQLTLDKNSVNNNTRGKNLPDWQRSF